MLNITDQIPETIYEGERVIRILTGNVMDELYTVTDLDGDELEEEIRRALRLKHGKGYRYEGFEDVTYLVEDADEATLEANKAWRGEGWYDIRWSDGGTYGEPRYCYDVDDLDSDLHSAYCEKTETHLPYPQFLWDGRWPHHTLALWCMGLQSYLDMSDVEYMRLTDDGREAVEELAKEWNSAGFDALLEDLGPRIWN